LIGIKGVLASQLPGASAIIRGDDRANLIEGTNGDDILLGEGGNDEIFALLGSDTLDGGPGDGDRLYGENQRFEDPATDTCLNGELVVDCDFTAPLPR
jgi:Ca2+-binding RTX toxin-like protein